MKEKTFETEMMDIGRIPNITAGLITIIYVIFFAGLQPQQLIKPGILAIVILLFLQFCIAPITNHYITAEIAIDLEEWKKTGLDKEERTELLKRIVSCPQKIAIQVFVVFLTGVGIWTLSFYPMFDIDKTTSLLSTGAAIFGAFVAAILALNYAEKLCLKYGQELVIQGIQKKQIDRYKFFGVSIKTLLILGCILPVLITNAITLLLFWRVSTIEYQDIARILSLALITTCNTVITLALSQQTYRRFARSMSIMKNSLSSIEKTNCLESRFIKTDLTNEVAYNMHLVNSIFTRLISILDRTKALGNSVQTAATALSVTTKQNSATALQQSTGIKEIVASMEDFDSLSKNIASRIGEVSLISGKTAEDVDEGFTILEQEIKKMSEITLSNEIIIKGIGNLQENMKSIQDIASLIGSIADQTKIIAFNAELETSSAGKNGASFSHVADDIRLLANTTVDSTRAIRAQIDDINESAAVLVKKSQNGTLKIEEGVFVSKSLYKTFSEIRSSSEETAHATAKIQSVIEQQNAASQQILDTLRQLANSLEYITDSTKSISGAAQNLESLSHTLEKITEEEKA